MSMIEQRLEEWKRRLLDLGRRNPLLYFNQPRRTAIQITVPAISQLFDAVLDGRRKLRFPEPTQASLLDLLAADGQEETAHQVRARPGDLDTTLEVEDLQRKLNRLRARARGSIEEQGINTLYLALGLLEWRESESSEEIVRSPLVLVPVALRYERNKPFVLEGLDEDVTDNAALRYRLEQDFHLELPALPDPEELTGQSVLRYISHVEQLVQSQGWRVLGESWLSTFSFESLVLYRDIADHMELYADHPILQWLAGDAAPESPDLPDLSDLDSVVSPSEVFPILDADDSQLEVILRARAGQNLVVHGPPGTGKSQTIANLIAQSVRDGKTVLFVSRKMAALEVVYDRLERAGLGDLCLEVHSHRANKKDVIRRLNASLERGPYHSSEGTEEFERLSRLRERLNAYAKALRRPADSRGRCPYDVYGILAKLSDTPDSQAPVTSEDAVELSREREEELRSAIQQLASLAEVFDGAGSHPWRGAALRRVSPQDRREVADALRGAKRSIEEIQGCWRTVGELTGLEGPESPEKVSTAVALAEHLTSAPFLPCGFSSMAIEETEKLARKLSSCVKRAQQMTEARTEYSLVFTDQVFDLPVAELAERYRTAYRSRLRFLRPTYRRDSAQLRSVSASGKTVDYKRACDGLSACVEHATHRDWLESQADSLRAALGPMVEGGADSDWEEAKSTVGWVTTLLRMSALSTLPDGLAEAAATRPEAVQAVGREAAGKLRETDTSLQRSVEHLVRVFPEGYDGTPISLTHFDALSEQLDSWLNSLSSLDDWCHYNRALDRCEELGLSLFVQDAKERGIPGEVLPDALQKAFASAWVTGIHNRQPVLADFNPAEYDRLRDDFRRLDKDLQRAAIRATIASATAARPIVSEGAVLRSPIGILRHQAQLQRRHQPLRRLLPAIRSLLPTLKPCLLMSPLSVASYLPPDVFQFDLVIFDEASQIPPEEAVGAIVRGRQILVAGDEKQLPPTSFFRAMVADDSGEDDEEADLTPMLDSILEGCIPLFPEAYLLWHYRSKHESLIAFSNQEFYDGRLITFPSPEQTADDGGVRFLHVPEGVFDRGGSRTNRGEARRVAEMVIEHLRRWPTRSLGVITMSIQQQEAIEHELSRLRLENQDMEEAFGEDRVEHFFAKNLERVQGDERDSLIISLGYGPDHQGVVRMQFGPLSRPGGQRRLNVAVTRGKIQTTLVTSLLPHQLDLSRLTTGSGDVAVLQRYLQYAANGGRFGVEVAACAGEPESPFEEAVLGRLRREGLGVDSQVGASSFRIDLAIRHPDRPGRYVLGIECDGATFHRTRSARERDRLRQEVLEGLGWRIFRIWSPDWLRDANRVVSRIVERVEELRRSGEIGLPANPGGAGLAPGRETTAENVLGDWVARGNVSSFGEMGQTGSPTGDLAEYVPYRAKSERPGDRFYDSPLSELSRIVVEVVDFEAPVHISVVSQRIANAYGFGRVGAIIRDRVFRAIQAAVNARRVSKRGEFLWRKRQYEAKPRRPRTGDIPRRIVEISLEEIATAAEWVLKQQISLPHDDLVRQAARVLGYDRAGQQIQERVGSAVRQLQNDGRIEDHGGSLSLAASPELTRRREEAGGASGRASEEAGDKVGTETEADEMSAGLAARLRKLGLEIVDRRQQGGMLWAIGGEELSRALSPRGFKFAPHGGRATQNRPSWWYRGRE